MDRSRNLDDALDRALDAAAESRAAPCPQELAPLAEVAAALRAELATIEVDPAVARQHLQAVLGPRPGIAIPGPAAPATAAPGAPATNGSHAPPAPLPFGVVVPPPRERPPVVRPPFGVLVPEREQPGRGAARRWRVRVVAGLAAAALLLGPAALASGGSLPGDVLYPVKLVVEQARLAADGGAPVAVANLRIGVAGTRLHELRALLDHGEVARLIGAITRAQHAVDQATRAVVHAQDQGAAPHELATLRQGLQRVQVRQTVELTAIIAQLPRTTTSVSAKAAAMTAARRALDHAGAQRHIPGIVPGTTVGPSVPTAGPPASAAVVPPATTAAAPATTALPAPTTEPVPPTTDDQNGNGNGKGKGATTSTDGPIEPSVSSADTGASPSVGG